MSKANYYEVLAAYKRNQRQFFVDRDVLQAHQRRYFHRLLKETLPNSNFYKKRLGEPLDNWPVMTGQLLMEHFNKINTAGVLYNEVFAKAVRAGISRHYQHFAGYNTVTTLLSSGTKSRQRVFIINREEQLDRIGDILARMFPKGFQKKVSVAYLYRSNNFPHFKMDADVVDFQIYDLFTSFDASLQRLTHQQPNIIVGPVSVLLYMALMKLDGNLPINCDKVYTAGEVLTPRDKTVLRRAFGDVGEIYYAAEGLLGMTCEYGKLHLNEEKYFFEKEFLDPYRFTAVISNFSATSLPLIRYRLDDVLHIDPQPCHCGRVSQVVRAIEGRLDDVFMLPAKNTHKRVMIFPATQHDIITKTIPWRSEYRLIQNSPNEITFSAEADHSTLLTCCQYLKSRWANMGVDTAQLSWKIVPYRANSRWMEEKNRRVQRLPFISKHRQVKQVNPRSKDDMVATRRKKQSPLSNISHKNKQLESLT